MSWRTLFYSKRRILFFLSLKIHFQRGGLWFLWFLFLFFWCNFIRIRLIAWIGLMLIWFLFCCYYFMRRSFSDRVWNRFIRNLFWLLFIVRIVWLAWSKFWLCVEFLSNSTVIDLFRIIIWRKIINNLSSCLKIIILLTFCHDILILM